mgnify:CR=1 FL=1
MKKQLIITSLIALSAIAPNVIFGQTTKKKVAKSVKTAAPAKPAASNLSKEITEGKALLAKSDCLACHKLDVKLVGPAYNNVAQKYPATPGNYEQLAAKIIRGGAGVWGEVAMAPHSTLPMADAKKMVKYILSLR